MSFPNFPNPARRAKLLQAHHLRQQGLTLRQIAREMNCAHSTVAAYLKDFELFRADLIQELAADQLVVHLLQLADLDDPHHDRRRADIRELRLLLTAVPKIRRDESERTQELVQGGVSVDRYGQRYPRPEHFFPPTPEEIEQINQPHGQPRRPSSTPTNRSPSPPNPAEQNRTPPNTPNAPKTPTHRPEQNRTSPNKRIEPIPRAPTTNQTNPARIPRPKRPTPATSTTPKTP